MARLINILLAWLLITGSVYAGQQLLTGQGTPGASSGDTLLVGDDTEYSTSANSNGSSGRVYFFKSQSSTYTAAASGTAAKAYIRFNAVDTDDWKICVYEDADHDGCSDGNCDLVGCSDVVDGTTAGLNEAPITSTFSITAGHYYHVGLFTNGYLSIQIYDDGATNWCNDIGSWPTPPDPWVQASYNLDIGKVTIYVTD